jgi:hypothetical protein
MGSEPSGYVVKRQVLISVFTAQDGIGLGHGLHIDVMDPFRWGK